MARIHQMTIPQFEKAFVTEEDCIEYLMSHRWPSGVIVCPRCGETEKVFSVKTMAYKWQCYSCSPDSGYRFSVIAGTIFENTNKPLREWFRVIHMMMTSKKGVSALQIHRVMGFGSYRTAWYMCHRVRAGLADEKFRQLMGIVEVDETYIGGDPRNMHRAKRRERGIKVGRGTHKIMV
ncbi:MAG TPA: IS1595 family transposase, partial [Caulobacteraceae bacterium]|nr:IS1595 family transposase [Caulobacteraceae bacterium]